MIILTKLDGRPLALNTDLIERAEELGATVVTLVSGAQYPVAESVPEVVAMVRESRASVLIAVKRQEEARKLPGATLHVLPGAGR